MGNSQRVDYRDKSIILYTAQRNRIVAELMAEKRHVVKKKFIHKKYGETAQVFLQAYAWYTRKANEIVKKPRDAESAIWTFCDVKYLDCSSDSRIIELSIPIEKAVFFRMSDWNRILNLRFLGSQEEEKNYYTKLKHYNVAYEGDVYTTAFYPHLKSELVNSWDKLFQYDQSVKPGLFILQLKDFYKC